MLRKNIRGDMLFVCDAKLLLSLPMWQGTSHHYAATTAESYQTSHLIENCTIIQLARIDTSCHGFAYATNMNDRAAHREFGGMANLVKITFMQAFNGEFSN